MECNVSRYDGYVRIGISIALIVLGIVLLSSVGILGLIVPVAVAGILLFTVRMSWCPIYAALGISTCGAQENA